MRELWFRLEATLDRLSDVNWDMLFLRLWLVIMVITVLTGGR
jgi:hypothetical protein